MRLLDKRIRRSLRSYDVTACGKFQLQREVTSELFHLTVLQFKDYSKLTVPNYRTAVSISNFAPISRVIYLRFVLLLLQPEVNCTIEGQNGVKNCHKIDGKGNMTLEEFVRTCTGDGVKNCLKMDGKA